MGIATKTKIWLNMQKQYKLGVLPSYFLLFADGKERKILMKKTKPKFLLTAIFIIALAFTVILAMDMPWTEGSNVADNAADIGTEIVNGLQGEVDDVQNILKPFNFDPNSIYGEEDGVSSENSDITGNDSEIAITESALLADCLASNYTDEPYVEINGNIPFFTIDEITTDSYEFYSELDELGRCGYAMACVGTDIMPTEERGSIGSVKPTGWHTVKYDGIDGVYLYNRCHLIAYCLTGENANPKNLITGTRYLNVTGMLPFEIDVAKYVEETGNHVMYRVTPIFTDNNLVAEGVLMEAYSVEDGGELQFCVFAYNVQPGITINYATGESDGPEYTGSK
jgi:DNA-entry nuclease